MGARRGDFVFVADDGDLGGEREDDWRKPSLKRASLTVGDVGTTTSLSRPVLAVSSKRSCEALAIGVVGVVETVAHSLLLPLDDLLGDDRVISLV